MISPVHDIRDLLTAHASSGRIAFQLGETPFVKIIAVLRQHFGLSYQQAELLLIDLMREHEDALCKILRDRIRLDDAHDAVGRCLGDDR